MNLQNMKRGETTEQISLFNWAERNAHVLPCLSLMYHVPNEGKRTNGAVLKAMGLKTGVPDVVLPVASHNFHGLYLEMKYGTISRQKHRKSIWRRCGSRVIKQWFAMGQRKQKRRLWSTCRTRSGCHLQSA